MTERSDKQGGVCKRGRCGGGWGGSVKAASAEAVLAGSQVRYGEGGGEGGGKEFTSEGSVLAVVAGQQER